MTARMLCCKRSDAATRFGTSFRSEASLSKGKKDDRIVIGLASVFGNIDAANDVVDVGAFDGAILDFLLGNSRARLLWNHDSREPPIGQILSMRTLTRDQLPKELIVSDPDITGALQVTKKYFEDAFADRVYQGVITGAISEMSFAYEVKRSRPVERNGKTVNILEDLEIFDISDVNWGCNSATIARVTSSKEGRTQTASTSRKAVLRQFRSQIFALAVDSGKHDVVDRVLRDINYDLVTTRAHLALGRSRR